MKSIKCILLFFCATCLTLKSFSASGAGNRSALTAREREEAEFKAAIDASKEEATKQKLKEQEEFKRALKQIEELERKTASQKREEAQLQAAIEASKKEAAKQALNEREELQRALKQIEDLEKKSARQKREEAELQAAIEASKKEAAKQKLKEQEEKDLQAAIRASLQTPEFNREEEELNRALKEVSEYERQKYEEELRKSASFYAKYDQAISPTNVVKINVKRVDVVQQKDIECGYLAVINAVFLYNALQKKDMSMLKKLSDPKFIDEQLKKAQKILDNEKALECYHMTTILDKLFNIEIGSQIYSVYDQLPDSISALRSINKPIVNVLKKLRTDSGFTHIFFLQKAGADINQANLGHWISVVAHNNGDKSIDVYVLDSQYPKSDDISAKYHRMNHDKAWQAFVILLNEAGRPKD